MQKYRLGLPALCAAALVGLVGAPALATAGTAQTAVKWIDAPVSVATGALESDGSVQVFSERSDYRLPSDVTVDASAVGVYREAADYPQVKPKVAAGTEVDVHYVHADRVGASTSPVRFTGELTFAGRILGVITSSDTLAATHRALGHAGTTYPSSQWQGLEPAVDGVEIVDQHTIRLDTSVYEDVDQIRVITAPAVTVSGAAHMVAAPVSVATGALESDGNVQVFSERSDYRLPSDVTVDASAVGVYREAADYPQVKPKVAAGTEVDVHYVHADRVGASTSPVRFTGELTFAGRILGVITSSDTLAATHRALGHAGTTYPSSQWQGLEPAVDGVEIVDQHTIRLDTSVYEDVDQIRVITARG